MNTSSPSTVAAPGTGASASAARDGRDTRWEAHRAARREDLLIKARGAIHRLGPAASMEEIAQQSGTSKSVFYRYFQDKAGLSQALGEFLLSGLQARMIEAARGARGGSAVVREMIGAYLAMVQRSPAIHEFVTTYSGLGWQRPEGDQRPTASLGLFADHVAALLIEASPELVLTPPGGAADGRPAPQQTTSYWARAVVGMVHSVAEKWSREYQQGIAPPRDVVVEHLCDWILVPLQPRVR